MLGKLAIAALACVGTAPALIAGTIPVAVDRALPDYRPGAPVKFGVPFPRAVLKTDERVQVLDDRGAVVPHQQAVTATWDPAGAQGVRWLLVDFLTDAGRSYRIVHGPDLKPQVEAPPPVATLEQDLIKVDTGCLAGAIDSRKADLLGRLAAQGRPLVEADGQRFSGFFVEHEVRGIFRSDLDRAPTIVLEETGPIRATVKMDGWYTNDAGEKFCRYSVRAHFFRGRADVKLEHTFIYTGLSQDDKIRSLGLQLPQRSGMRGHIWGEGDLQNDIAQIFTSHAKVVLDSSNHDDIELVGSFPESETRRRMASRANAMFHYGYAAVAIRDGWQQYPLGFEVADGVMQVQLWPRGDRLLDTTFDGYWWFLDEHQKHFLMRGKRAAAEATPEELVGLYREKVNATGAAKTHEVWLSFHVDPREMNFGMHGGRLWREVENPVLARADLHWTTASRALDFCGHTPRDDVNFPEEERYLDTMLTMVRQLAEKWHWYGWWDWGGYYQSPGEPAGVFKDTHRQHTWNRNRPKSHYGWGQLPWLSYFRTGERRWLRYAQTYTLYSADRAFKHHSNEDPRFAGSEYHYDNSEIPWVGGYGGWPAGAEGCNNLQGKDDYVYMYWLTGDRRPLDVLKMWGNSLGGPITPADQIGSQWDWKVGFERGNDIRNAGHQLHRLMMLYQATWDERCLRTAKHVAESFAALQTEADVIAAEGDRRGPNGDDESRFSAAAGWAYEGLWLYYNVTGDERIKRTLLAFIERSVNNDSGLGHGYSQMRAYTYGYELTGDELYLYLLRGILDDYVGMWVTPASMSTTDRKWGSITLGRSLGTLASAPQSWKDANLPTHVRGRMLTYEYARSNDVAPNAYFLETADRAWRFRLLTNRGGKFKVLRPDGGVAYESPMIDFPFRRKWLEVEVPADGQTGTYTLQCVQASDWMKNLEGEAGAYARARIVRSDLPVVVGLNASAAMQRAPWDMDAPVFGRAFFLQPAQSPAVLHVGPSRGRSVLLAHDARTLATSLGRQPNYLGVYDFSIGGEWTGKVLELRPERPTDRYLAIPPRGSGSIGLLWFDGIPPYVAANPEDYFVPGTAKP
jgi:hypothetical protein